MNSNNQNNFGNPEESQGPISQQVVTDPEVAKEEFNKKLSQDTFYLDLKKSIEDLKPDNCVLTEENEKLKKQLSRLTVENDELKIYNSALKEENAQLNINIYRLTEENKQLLDENLNLNVYNINHLVDNQAYNNMIDGFVLTQRNLVVQNEVVTTNLESLVRPIRYTIPEYIPDYAGRIRCLVQLRNGQIASTTEDGKITFWKRLQSDAQEEPKFVEIKILMLYESPILCLIELESGLLASGCSDSRINIYDTNSEEIVGFFEGYGDKVLSLLELSNKLIASGSDDSTILLWKRSGLDFKYDIVAILRGHMGSVNALVQLSEDHIASGSNDEKIKIWSLTDFTCIITLEGHNSWVTSLFKLRSGDLISGSRDRSIKAWSRSRNYECVANLTGHLNEVTAVIQLRNGQIASASKDKTVRLWSSDNYEMSNIIEVCPENDEGIYSVAELNSGMIAVGSSKIFVINP